jgi:hypothetical protein
LADIEKVVRTKYKLDTKQAEAQAKRLQRRLKMVGKIADKVSGGIGRLGRAIAAPAGLGLAGAAGLVKHLVDVGREAEDAQLQLTGLLQGVSRSSNLPLQGFERARETASKLRLEFIKLAQDSPIAAKDVREAFEIGVFPLTRAGLSLSEQAEFARGIAIADLSNVVKGTTAADVRQLFQGISNPRMIQTGLLKPIAKEVASLAKRGEMAEAARVIQQQLKPDPKLLDAYGKSASGMLATFSDKIKLIKEKVAGPLLKLLIEKTSEWSAWLENNQERVAEIAKSIGEGIVKAVKAVIKAVKWIADNWKTILTIVKTLALVWIGGKLVSGISTLIGLASRFAGAMRDAAAASAAAGGGVGGRGGKLGLLGKVGGAVGLAVTAAAIGEDVGEGIGSLVAGKKGRAAVKRLEEWKSQSMSKDEYNAYVKSLEARRAKKASTTKKEEDVLNQQLDPTKAPRQRGAGGGGRTRVRKMEVARMEVRDRDFARLSSRFVVGIRRQSRAQRQIAGLGLGAGAIGVGV